MKTILKLALLFLVSRASAFGQAAPAATSGGADLRYSVHYSETAQLSGTPGEQQRISPSGSLDYSNGSAEHPFGMNFVGGYTWGLTNKAYATGFYQHFMVSQGLAGRGWNIGFGDDVSYRPQAPITGFSGVPGTGEPIGGVSANPPSSQSIMTLNTHALNNNAQAQVQHVLNYATSLSMGANYDLLIYPDGNGFDTRSLMTNGGLNFRLNARNSLTGRYVFSQYTYPDYAFTSQSHSAMFGFERTWSRSLSSSVSAGPEWISSSRKAAGTAIPVLSIPPSTMVSVQASVDYETRFGSASLAYRRGTMGGGGYLMGAKSDQVTASLSREFARKLTLETAGGYRRVSGLGSNNDISGEFGAIQSSWRLGRYVSAFAGYTAISQSSTAPVPSNVLSQLLQTVSFGIGYSREINPAH